MHYNYINRHGILLDKKILGEDVEEELKRVENELYMRDQPSMYGGEKGLLIKTEKEFELNCAILQQSGVHRPKTLTVSEFYNSIKVLEKRSDNGKPKRTKKN